MKTTGLVWITSRGARWMQVACGDCDCVFIVDESAPVARCYCGHEEPTAFVDATDVVREMPT